MLYGIPFGLCRYACSLLRQGMKQVIMTLTNTESDKVMIVSLSVIDDSFIVTMLEVLEFDFMLSFTANFYD